MNKEDKKEVIIGFSYKDKELPEPYRGMVDMIGLENTLILAKELGGTQLYFPSLYRETRNHQIIKEFNGYNINDLAKKYHITVKRVQQIIKEAKNENPSKY